MVAVLFVFYLLYKQAIQVSTMAPEVRGEVSVFVPPGKIYLRGPASLHYLPRCLRSTATCNKTAITVA